MAFHYPVNNYRATLAAPLTPTDLEIVLDEGGGGPLTRMPCFVSIENEIIEVQERKRAWTQTGTESMDRIFWGAAQDGGGGNGVSITLADPGAPNASLSVSVSNSAVTISLATDGDGNLFSTVDDVLLALAQHTGASGLLFGFSGETGVVAAAAETVLSGGDNDILNVTDDYGGRGAQGTSATNHPAGSYVEIRFTAEHLLELQSMAGIQLLYPGQFTALTGTPSLEDVQLGETEGHKAHAWKFAAGQTGAVSLMFVLLPTFRGRRLEVLLFWYSKSPDTGNCRWTIRAKAMNWMFGPTVAGQPELVSTANCGAPGAEQLTMYGVVLEFPGMGIGGGPMTLVIERDGTSSEDTFAGDAWLLEVAALEAE